ncbi:Charged multivesicular body protein [Wickerhamomyces ciferrii]|uniref:Charged multivesicular body protein n=1 Tax=Wickerhamomyces ciferrii (strain ATCC 14091 / BCRC 22168 / CBS 111 / JCM 3599 / NBRC 0793 / NRRL Y-1031 F-60-10) TaxID=1206466 RepID=K0KUT2_WICCF|nr:Charged multivesicular body protein [Wickerhamomyces ciferrii]CCH46971.1 Charged multivesicular body protein [Wickerhamomyces ciferrii]
MNRLFGSKSNIEERISSLDVKLAKINAELQTYQQKLSRMREGPGKKTIKQRALNLLKQRRQIEAQKQQLDSQVWNMTQAQMTTDNLQNTMITVDAMKTTNKQLKKTYGKIDVDKIEDLQDEMLDLIEKSNELQDALATSYDVPDEISEGELDAELEALGDEIDYEQELQGEIGSGLPSYLNNESEVPQFIDEPVEGGKEKEVAS